MLEVRGHYIRFIDIGGIVDHHCLQRRIQDLWLGGERSGDRLRSPAGRG
jgi:hypothetical protein